MIVLFSAALAGEAPMLGVQAAGEMLQQEELARVYGGSSLGVDGEAVFVVAAPVEAHVELGYRRVLGSRAGGSGGAVSLWYAPLSATVDARYVAGKVTSYAGLGPTVVPWGEDPAGDAAGTTGTKFGLVVEGGVRVRTAWVEPSLHHPDQGVQSLDWTVGLSWRKAFTGQERGGLDFSALRLGAGVLASF